MLLGRNAPLTVLGFSFDAEKRDTSRMGEASGTK
jgi:hypothetical protein